MTANNYININKTNSKDQDNGILEGIVYLQSSMSCQVVECPWLDWCNLIGIQITTTYEIRTKYNDNLRPNKYTESQKTKFVQPEPT
jgi:uncharacterized protein (UPF0179 family)